LRYHDLLNYRTVLFSTDILESLWFGSDGNRLCFH